MIGTAAILIVATEGAGPDLPLDERAARLLADCDEPVAIFSIEGKLIHATSAADPYLLGAGWLAALGAAAAATDALSTGHAQERSVHGSITIDRIGRESTTVLLATFGPPDESDKMASPAVADVPAIEPVSAEPAMPEQTDIERTDILQAEPPAVPAPASPPAPPEPMAREPIALTPTPAGAAFAGRAAASAALCLADRRRRTLHARLGGIHRARRTAAPPRRSGRTWPEIAGELGLDPERRVERALASHDTWSGLTVAWPVDGSDERLAVELSGLPAFDRERVFRGYRGFGVCRDVARLNRLAQMRSGIEPTAVRRRTDRKRGALSCRRSRDHGRTRHLGAEHARASCVLRTVAAIDPPAQCRRGRDRPRHPAVRAAREPGGRHAATVRPAAVRRADLSARSTDLRQPGLPAGNRPRPPRRPDRGRRPRQPAHRSRQRHDRRGARQAVRADDRRQRQGAHRGRVDPDPLGGRSGACAAHSLPRLAKLWSPKPRLPVPHRHAPSRSRPQRKTPSGKPTSSVRKPKSPSCTRSSTPPPTASSCSTAPAQIAVGEPQRAGAVRLRGARARRPLVLRPVRAREHRHRARLSRRPARRRRRQRAQRRARGDRPRPPGRARSRCS